MRKLQPLLFVIVSLSVAAAAQAWTPKEYAFLSRQAAADLLADPLTPESMRRWLTAALGEPCDQQSIQAFLLHQHVGPFGAGLKGLSYWSAVPDLIAATDAGRRDLIEPFGVPERALHYLDLERLNKQPQDRSFVPSLAHKPAFSDIPRSILDPRYLQAGMLPFRAEQCRRQLVDAIVAGRLDEHEGDWPRDDHAVRWAGYLAHYVADGWEPQHATMDYSFRWALPQQADAGDAVREAFGVRLCDDEREAALELKQEYYAAFLAACESLSQTGLPIQAKDTWEGSVEALRYSYDSLPLIGHAAAAALDPHTGRLDLATFYHHRDASPVPTASLLETRARLQAHAAAQIRLEWLRAWEEARRLRPSGPDPLLEWQPH